MANPAISASQIKLKSRPKFGIYLDGKSPLAKYEESKEAKYTNVTEEIVERPKHMEETGRDFNKR